MAMEITINVEQMELTPEELAFLFCEMGGQDQADFFAAIWSEAKKWPGAGWCQQSYDIARFAHNNAIQAIRTLASHLPADDLAWIAAAGADT